ncbi:MAG TPA: nicotinate phosphoribosyltransferase [Candidatus Hydrogenedentes bacterium]|nr:nicotinate phosphoribosyltransferase [Candidatus Hydrogenedentota bacterium]
MNSGRPWFRREGLALLTDLYELTMMAGHWKDGRTNQAASFEYFFRTLPPHAGFAVTAGLDPFLDYLENLRFEEDDTDYLRTLGLFDEAFLTFLRDFHPKITVYAIPEGSLVFPFEPIVRIEGTLFETQLVETALLNFMNYQTLIATKAARICLAANSEPVMEFGLRRAHGPDGGLSGSRAAHIGGCASTSNVLAGKAYGIPIAGTHAHSWVMSFENELEAFRAFARHYPERCVLLVDTYDTAKSGIPNAIKVFQEMRAAGHPMRPAIRLDSGDLAKLSKIAWRMMQEAGLENPLIVASNDLDEDLIADLKRQGAKINAWGVGTHLITAYDSPALNGVYKLVALYDGNAWAPRMKLTSNIEKATDPGRKQVVRYFDAEGHPLCDMMCLADESWPESGMVEGRVRTRPHHRIHIEGATRAEALLQPVFLEGRRTAPRRPIAEIRDYARAQIAALPDEYKRLRNPEIYQVFLSNRIGEIKDQMLAFTTGSA